MRPLKLTIRRHQPHACCSLPILEAFAESREAKAHVTNQITTFKILLECSRIYASGSLIIYIFFENNLLQPLEAGLINEGFLTILDGRANIMLWLLILMNMSAYFNIAFKIMCLISIIVMLNATVDNLVLFTGLVSFEDRPYLTIFIIPRPLFLGEIIWMGIFYNSALADD